MHAQKMTAATGPFGTSMGMSKSQFKNIKKIEMNVYTGIPPNPSTLFDSYVLMIGNGGLCRITGMGVYITDTGMGVNTKSKYNKLLNILKNKYGKVDNFNYLQSGSIWNEPQDFMTALDEGEYILYSCWIDGENGISLPYNLNIISIKANAENSSQGYISITYDYKNIDECLSEIQEFETKDL